MNLFNALLGPRNSVDSDETIEDNDRKRSAAQGIVCVSITHLRDLHSAMLSRKICRYF